MVSQSLLSSAPFISLLVTLTFKSTFLDASVHPHIATETSIPFPHPTEHVAYLALEMARFLSHTATGLTLLAGQGRLSHHLGTTMEWQTSS